MLSQNVVIQKKKQSREMSLLYLEKNLFLQIVITVFLEE
jgi:hypothetical protein